MRAVAVGLSLALHAALGVVAWGVLREPEAVAPARVVVAVGVERVPQAPEVQPETGDRRPETGDRSIPEGRPRRPARRPVSAAAAVPAPPSDQDTGSAAVQPVVTSEIPGLRSPVSGLRSPVASPSPAPAPPPAPDPDSIRSSISAAIHYPRLARSQGLSGRVLVRFRVQPDGSPAEVSILESAGPILDAAARDAVARAAPFRSPPGWVRVPVDFSLHPAP
jgi:periplasmic protein TonB